jgi:hypothetical protein
VPHMDAPGRIGEHLQDVVFGRGSSVRVSNRRRSSQTDCQCGSTARGLYRSLDIDQNWRIGATFNRINGVVNAAAG